MIGDRLARDPMGPPVDALAEAVVLWGLLQSPHRIADYDPTLLLVYPEHRDVLTAMKRAHAATQGESWGHFYVRFMHECDVIRPGQGEALCALLDGTAIDQSRLQWQQSDRSRAEGMGLAEYHNWPWWWQRLKDVAECRRFIRAAHAVVDRSWQCDIEGARAAVQSIHQEFAATAGFEIP